MPPITGTVSVGFDGMETQSVGTFSIPVHVIMDPETGLAHVEGATDSSIIFAMVAALQGAANELLATLPTVKAETIAVCPTCGAELGVADSSITIEHAQGGAHIENHRY
jgi:hypothetical protein